MKNSILPPIYTEKICLRNYIFYNLTLISFGTFESKSIKGLSKACNKNCHQNSLTQFPVYTIIALSTFKILGTLEELSRRIPCDPWYLHFN